MKVCYAVQVCDLASNQGHKRFASDDRSEITEKCVTSLLSSIEYVVKNEPQDSWHHVRIIEDKSSVRVKEFLQRAKERFQSERVVIDIVSIENGGIMNSIRACWQWLSEQDTDLVYQVQDDYMFYETAIVEMIDLFVQTMSELKTEPVVISYNYPRLWNDTYRHKVTPRCILNGKKRYWIQSYDTPCTFLTSKNEFNKHWELYEKFLNTDPNNERLEADSLNKMFVQKGVLGLLPINSVALHMQSDFEKDPYVDWKILWDSIEKV